MRSNSSSRRPVDAARDRGAGRRWRAGSRALGAAALVLPLLLPLAAAPRAAAQEPEPGEPEKGTTVLVIPPASPNLHRPPEIQTREEYVLRGGLDETRRRRGYEQPADLIAGYRSVLTLLSSGRREDALDALFAFETAAMEGRGPQEISRLFDAEVAVVRALGSRDLESLVPILVLHHDAYPMYVERARPFLAAHSSRLAASLADLYAREGGTEGSRVLAARVLASLGIYGQQKGVKLQSLGLMLHALDLDPQSEAALLGIAVVHERGGNYHRAAERLQALLQASPQHREGRLRMAVNLDRLGDARQVRALLEALVAEPARDWVASVACQELGRIHREAGRHDRAEQVLRQGLERFPEDGRIRTQLAFVLDHRGESGRALSVVQELAAFESGGEPSPRRLYGIGPQEAYREVLVGLQQSASARLPRLARLVDPRSAGDRPAGVS